MNPARSSSGPLEVEPSPTAASADPDWIRAGLSLVWSEGLLYLATVREILLHPLRFGADFAAGARTMNPVGFLATTAACLAVEGAVYQSFMTGGGTRSLAYQLLVQLGPYLRYALLGALIHLVLWLSGTTRRMRTTVALVLFMAAGPLAILELFGELSALWARVSLGATGPQPLHLQGHPGFMLLIGVHSFGAVAAFYAYTTLLLVGAHVGRRTRLTILPAILLVQALFALLAAVLLYHGISPEIGSYQPQLLLDPFKRSGWWINLWW